MFIYTVSAPFTFSILVYGSVNTEAQCLLNLRNPHSCPVLCLKHCTNFLFAGLRDGTMMVYGRSNGGKVSPWPPERRSGLRHCIASALVVPLEILGSSPGSVAAGRARETHGTVHNWPSIVQVRCGFGRQGCPCPIEY